jgi:hypothetical protein
MENDSEEASRAYNRSLSLDDPDAARVLTMAIQNEVRFVREPPPGVVSDDPDHDRLNAYRHLEAVRRVASKGNSMSELMVAFVTGS